MNFSSLSDSPTPIVQSLLGGSDDPIKKVQYQIIDDFYENKELDEFNSQQNRNSYDSEDILENDSTSLNSSSNSTTNSTTNSSESSSTNKKKEQKKEQKKDELNPHSEYILSGIMLQGPDTPFSDMYLIPEKKDFPIQTNLLGPFLMRENKKLLDVHFFVITSQSGTRYFIYTLNLYGYTLSLLSTYRFHNTFQRLLIAIAESGMKKIELGFVKFIWNEFSNCDNGDLCRNNNLICLRNHLNKLVFENDETFKLWIDLRRYETFLKYTTSTFHSEEDQNNDEVNQIESFHFPNEPILFCILKNSKSFPLCESDLRILTSSLSAENLVSIIEYIMSEQQIIFCSRYFRRISETIESILSLIYPFEWPYVYIPMLPRNLFDFLSAPTPYLIGVNMGYEEFMKIPKNLDYAIVVDLDWNLIHNAPNGDSDFLSPNTDSQLKNRKTSNTFLNILGRGNINEVTEPQKVEEEGFSLPVHIRSQLINDLTPFYLRYKQENTPQNNIYSNKRRITTKNQDEEYEKSNSWESSDDDDDLFEQEINANLPTTEAVFSTSDLFRNSLDDNLILELEENALKKILEFNSSENLNNGENIPFVNNISPIGFSKFRKTFLKVFLNLFKSYRLFLKPPVENQSELPFDFERFIQVNVGCESTSMLNFYNIFFKTQIFSFFIQSRCKQSNKLDIFDDKSSGKMERFSISLALNSERTLSGYMWKLGRVRRSWKYRYFVLRGNMIKYYTDNSQTKLRGTFEIIPGETIVYIPRQFEKHKTKFPFVIRTHDRTLLCCLETRNALLEWCRILQAKSTNIEYRELIDHTYAKKNLFMQNFVSVGNNFETTFMLRQEPWITFIKDKMSQ